MTELYNRIQNRGTLYKPEADYWNNVVTTTRYYFPSHPASSWPEYPECRYAWKLARRPPPRLNQGTSDRKRRTKIDDQAIYSIKSRAITRGPDKNVAALAREYNVSESTIISVAYSYGRYSDV